MNVRRISFLIIVGAIMLSFALVVTVPKITKVKSQDVIYELNQAAKKRGVKLQNVYLTAENRLQGEVDGVTIIFSRDKSFDSQMVSLQKLLKSSTINSNTKQVDFRFNKLVVK